MTEAKRVNKNFTLKDANAYALELYNKGQLAEAERICKSILAQVPKQFDMLNLLGVINFQSGAFDAARTHFQAALKINPNSPDLLSNMGAVYEQLSDPNRAKKAFEKAIKLRPNLANAHANLATILRGEKRHKDAIAHAEKALQIEPNHLDAMVTLGSAHLEIGALDEAAMYLEKALELNPTKIPALYNCAETNLRLDKIPEAAALYTRALECDPGHNNAKIGLSICLLKLNKFEDALAASEQGLEADPRNYNANVVYVKCLEKLGRLDKALEKINSVIEIDENDHRAYKTKSSILSALNRPEDARKVLGTALQLKEDDDEIHRVLGNIELQFGNKETSETAFRRSLELNPGNPKALYSLAGLLDFKDETHTPLIGDMLESLEKRSSQEVSLSNVYLLFALSKAYESLGDYDNSFTYLKRANDVRKSVSDMYIHEKEVRWDGVARLSQNEVLANLSPSFSTNDNSSRSIFITGMPRSGTTLTEQIISSHSEVYGAGELTQIARICGPLLNESNISYIDIDAEIIANLRADYLKFLSHFETEANVFTDKLPINFRFIGFIFSAFPNAKVINLKRDPRAVAWSIYKQNFTADGNSYAYSFDDIAHFYRLHLDLMDFWHEQFPGKIYDLDYRTLTEDQEQESRKLIAYCGLEWEDACLNFHKNKRAIKTASLKQVREKIYTGSTEAWRKFEKHLDPMLDALAKYEIPLPD